MAPGRFLLVVTRDPTAADTFNINEMTLDTGLLSVGTTRKVKKKGWPAACDGQIIATGTEKALKAMKVSSAGVIINPDDHDTPAVANRFQELDKKKKEQNLSARERHLRVVSERLLRSGPVGMLNPLTGRSMLRLPKNRSKEELEPLRKAVDTLPCYTRRDGDVKLSIDKEVYLSGSALLMEQNLHPNCPSLLLRGLLGRLVPDSVSSHPGLTRSGWRNTVKFPSKVIEAANVSVQDFFMRREITIDPAYYNIMQVVKSFLEYKQSKFKEPSEATSSSSDVSTLPPPPVVSASSLPPTLSAAVPHPPASSSLSPVSHPPASSPLSPVSHPPASSSLSPVSSPPSSPLFSELSSSHQSHSISDSVDNSASLLPSTAESDLYHIGFGAPSASLVQSSEWMSAQQSDSQSSLSTLLPVSSI